jgi:glycosyltransferase involved in cell wall biosynthesis
MSSLLYSALIDQRILRVTKHSLSVLVDLRSAFEQDDFGIPHENRQMFSLLHDLDGVDVTGLIQHPTQSLARNRLGHEPSAARKIDLLSRLVASTLPHENRFTRVAEHVLWFTWLELLVLLGVRLPLDRFDGSEFGDFIWRTMFARSLPLSQFERCRTARYVSLWAPWRSMQSTALFRLPRKYARVDTSGYDVLIAQTPWPGVVEPKTRLVVRYHDAMPLFLPHTVKLPRTHRFLHLTALQENAPAATFACVSEFARDQLLRVHPELDRRAFVVHNCISDEFLPKESPTVAVDEIVKSRVDPTTEPAFSTARRRHAFYKHYVPVELRFLLAVGTLEPRKNHLGLIAAWERLRSTFQFKLVLVGTNGWSNQNLLRAMERWQMRGELFHLSAVPSAELRALYSTATAVVCPSVAEGFDIPSVEALRCGATVVASDIPTHREILGDAALYFDPYSPAAMCDMLKCVIESEHTRKELGRKALLRAARFDKTRIAEQWQNLLDHCRATR